MKLFKRINIGASPVKIIIAFLFIAFACGLIILSCDQAPIFYNISIAPPERDPRIPGSPTNIIHIPGQAIYTGSRHGAKVYQNNVGIWVELPSPGGSLLELATDGTSLYALVYNGDVMKSTSIKKYNSGSWTLIHSSSSFSMQTLYGARGEIFAGAVQNNSSYVIYHYNDSPGVVNTISTTSLLSGAAEFGGDVFVATGNGVYKFSGVSLAAAASVPGNIIGIIGTGGAIIAISSSIHGDGIIHESTDGIAFSIVPTGFNFTGGMCVWKTGVYPGVPTLLLLGARGGTSDNGYREMALTPTGVISSYDIRTPGPVDSRATTVSNRSKYNAGIAKHPVESILQAPYVTGAVSEAGLPIFASTTLNGLWSYRNEEWNAEE